MTTVYKVVRFVDNKYLSAVVWDLKEYKRIYEIGKTVYPVEGSYLFAFSNLNDAVSFIADSKHFTLLEAEAVIKKSPFVYAANAFWEPRAIKEFWTDDYYGAISSPKGSVWCKSITPIKEIPWPRL